MPYPDARDPMAVVVGVPGLDCADHPKGDTVEIHPAYAVAIRIQEYPKPEQWAFFYRDSGDNGECGDSTYRRCGTTFQLPLALPFVPAGKVLTSADVHVDAQPWAVDDTSPADVTVDSHFDRANGTVLSIMLPGKTDNVGEGVVGLVTVTPVFDTTPPTITCPPNEVVSATSPSGATVTYPAPVVSDNCSVVSTSCTPASGSVFAIGTSTVTCVAGDDSSNTSSCPFTIHVKGAAEQITDLIALVGSFHLEPGSQHSLLAKLTQALKDLADGKVGVACNELRAFINEVNAQKKAQNRQLGQNPAEADQLIAAATQIRAVLGCGP